MVHHEKKDLPSALKSLGTNDADEACTEYRRRVYLAKEATQKKRLQGLGYYVHMGGTDITPPNPLDIVPEIDLENNSTGSLLNADLRKDKKLPGEAKKRPKTSKKQGGLFAWVERVEQDKMEMDMRRQEKMQEIMMARHQKAQDEQKQI